MTTKKSNSSNSKMVTFRLTEREYQRLNALVKEAGVNRSQFIAKKCFSDVNSKKYIGLTLGYLETMGNYLIDLKNGDLNKGEFLEKAHKEMEYLWRSLN